VCRQLERAPSLGGALPRGMPWLLGTVAGSGVVWGLVPWMGTAASSSALLFAARFNIALIFAVINAPGTRALVLCAVLPVMLLTTSALLWRHGHSYAGLVCAGLCGLILLYGLRVQAAIQAAMAEHHTAHYLADALRHQQQRLIELEGERALLLERQRLMRDLHDGLGSTLTSSLIAVETGNAEAQFPRPLRGRRQRRLGALSGHSNAPTPQQGNASSRTRAVPLPPRADFRGRYPALRRRAFGPGRPVGRGRLGRPPAFPHEHSDAQDFEEALQWNWPARPVAGRSQCG